MGEKEVGGSVAGFIKGDVFLTGEVFIRFRLTRRASDLGHALGRAKGV